MTILSVADQTDNTLWGVAPPKNAEALTARQKKNPLSATWGVGILNASPIQDKAK